MGNDELARAVAEAATRIAKAIENINPDVYHWHREVANYFWVAHECIERARVLAGGRFEPAESRRIDDARRMIEQLIVEHCGVTQAPSRIVFAINAPTIVDMLAIVFLAANEAATRLGPTFDDAGLLNTINAVIRTVYKDPIEVYKAAEGRAVSIRVLEGGTVAEIALSTPSLGEDSEWLRAMKDFAL